MKILKMLGLGFVFLWFFFGGIGHFLHTSFFASIVPPYIPYPWAAVYISGVCEILGAIGILIPATRLWAGNGLLLLTVCVTPANVHMWMHPESFPDFSPRFLGVRLIIQVLLLACIWWSTRPNSKPVKAAA